jgi:ribonuclease P protein component
MLPKKNRADKKAVEQIFKSSKSLSFEDFSFKYILLKDQNTPKISVLAPKTITKKAVDRNFLRRLGYLALTKYIKEFPSGVVGVVVFKKYQNNVLIIENEIKSLLDKIS